MRKTNSTNSQEEAWRAVNHILRTKGDNCMGERAIENRIKK